MSRQKRVSRSHREMVYMHPAHFVLSFLAIFSGETAPLASVLRAAINWAATNFLHTDYLHRHFAQPAFAVALSGLAYGPPPATAGRIAAFGLPVSPRSSLPLISLPCRLRAAL
ncbi:hypothetical protein [Terracidiphilus gabretensis]|jgi:hypothetical protein|uniref:hypothetical protein n=1 Tax=Terracidiphilus gabretensis TaxID=1577687 RepID=UPI0012F91A1C|nr:hypothetical protein [Terracidiphilus gabretensis]